MAVVIHLVCGSALDGWTVDRGESAPRRRLGLRPRQRSHDPVGLRDGRRDTLDLYCPSRGGPPCQDQTLPPPAPKVLAVQVTSPT